MKKMFFSSCSLFQASGTWNLGRANTNVKREGTGERKVDGLPFSASATFSQITRFYFRVSFFHILSTRHSYYLNFCCCFLSVIVLLFFLWFFSSVITAASISSSLTSLMRCASQDTCIMYVPVLVHVLNNFNTIKFCSFGVKNYPSLLFMSREPYTVVTYLSLSLSFYCRVAEQAFKTQLSINFWLR